MKKSIFFIGILVVVISCGKKANPPSEKEITDIVAQYYSPKDLFPSAGKAKPPVDHPWTVKEIQVLKVERKAGSNSSFNIVAVSKGKFDRVTLCLPSVQTNYIDTVTLELKAGAKEGWWVTQKMDHHITHTEIDDRYGYKLKDFIIHVQQ
jgi:hypothetical protein